MPRLIPHVWILISQCGDKRSCCAPVCELPQGVGRRRPHMCIAILQSSNQTFDCPHISYATQAHGCTISHLWMLIPQGRHNGLQHFRVSDLTESVCGAGSHLSVFIPQRRGQRSDTAFVAQNTERLGCVPSGNGISFLQQGNVVLQLGRRSTQAHQRLQQSAHDKERQCEEQRG